MNGLFDFYQHPSPHSGKAWNIVAGEKIRFYEADKGWSGVGTVVLEDPRSTQLYVTYVEPKGGYTAHKTVHRTWCVPYGEVDKAIIADLPPPTVTISDAADDWTMLPRKSPDAMPPPAHDMPIVVQPSVAEPSIWNAFSCR